MSSLDECRPRILVADARNSQPTGELEGFDRGTGVGAVDAGGQRVVTEPSGSETSLKIANRFAALARRQREGRNSLNSSINADFDRAPVSVFTTSPSRNTKSVGMLITRYRVARSG